jgi:hypothetical protein
VPTLVKYFEDLAQRELRFPKRSVEFKRISRKVDSSQRPKLSVSQPNTPVKADSIFKQTEDSCTLRNVLISPLSKRISTPQPFLNTEQPHIEQDEKRSHSHSHSDSIYSTNQLNCEPAVECLTAAPSTITSTTTTNVITDTIDSIPQTTVDVSTFKPITPDFESPEPTAPINSYSQVLEQSDKSSLFSASSSSATTTATSTTTTTATTTATSQTLSVSNPSDLSAKKTPPHHRRMVKSPQRSKSSPRVSEPVRSPTTKTKTPHSPRPSEILSLSPIDTSRTFIAEEILRSEETYASLLDNLVKVHYITSQLNCFF